MFYMTVFEHQDISKSKKQKIMYTTKIWLNMTRICIYMCISVYAYIHIFFWQNWNDTIQCSVCFTVIYGFWGFLSFTSFPIFLLSEFSRVNLYFLDIRRIVFFYKTLHKGKKFRKQEETHHDKVSSLLQSCKGLECCRTCWTHCKWHPQT